MPESDLPSPNLIGQLSRIAGGVVVVGAMTVVSFVTATPRPTIVDGVSQATPSSVATDHSGHADHPLASNGSIGVPDGTPAAHAHAADATGSDHGRTTSTEPASPSTAHTTTVPVEPTTTTSLTSSSVPTTAPPVTTAPPMTSPPTVLTGTSASGPLRLVVAQDTTVVNQRLVLRPGDSIEFRNGARLMFHHGASADWQGTPTSTWSDDGRVQNLERDIEIFGAGDIMFMAGSLPSTIRFVEIDLQPKRELGHYPLHWHLVGDGSRGTLVEGVVVKNSTNRAYVPHGSHGITFRDIIAKNISGEGFWWDPPKDASDGSNNSNDIVVDRALVDLVTNAFDDNRGFTLSAFSLGAGVRNTVRHSVALNIRPSSVKNCSGFSWPAVSAHRQPVVWTFEDNATFGSACNGIFVWQNTGQQHVINGFRGDQIAHGAYSNIYEYRNITVPRVIIHAVGWSVTSGTVGEVRAVKHQTEGTVTFSDVTVGRLVVDNAAGNGKTPGHYAFDRTGLTCSDVDWQSVVPGTSVTIDGSLCHLP